MGRRYKPEPRQRHKPRQQHIDIDEFANSGSLPIMNEPGPEDYPDLQPPPPDPMTFTPTSAHYGRRPPAVRKEVDRGKTVLCEVLLVAVMMVLGLAGVAGQFVTDRWTTTHTYRQSLAQDLLQEAVQAVHAYSFDALESLDGSTVHDSGDPESSNFAVEIAVSATNDDKKLCVNTVLLDTRTRVKIAETVIYREPS